MPSNTTDLDAVNTLLSVVGEAPVNTLVPPVPASVAAAQTILKDALREVLVEGWHFNTEYDVDFVPDVNQEIAVPSDVISVDTVPGQYVDMDITTKDGKLYNKAKRTFLFTQPIKAEVVYFREFENIPEAARRYVVAMASRRFFERLTDQAERAPNLIRDEAMARARLMAEETEAADYTIFDNWGVARIVNRRSPLLSM